MHSPDNLSSFLKLIQHPNDYDQRFLKQNKIKLDPKIKESIYNINNSDWLWTIWSCQGHLVGKEKDSIPYFTFIVDKNYLGRLLFQIHLSFPKKADLDFPIYNNGYWYSISQGIEDDNYCVINWHLYFPQGKVGLSKIQDSMISFAKNIEVLDVKE
jgi:hypothetical protein